jgi:menaquinone-9 beta-reductase
MTHHTDVLVIGARVAGSVLAARLGDAGTHVVVADAATFPSATLSTHFFRGEGLVDVLDDLEVLDEVLALGAPKLTRQYFHVGSAGPIEQPPQRPGRLGYALSVRREALDEILIRRAAAAPTVDVRLGTRMKELLWDGDRVVGARLLRDGREEEVRARVTVGADGRGSTVARLVEAPVMVEASPARAMYYGYVRGFAAPGGGVTDGPEFSVVDDEMVYVFPSDGDLTCIALSVNAAVFAALKGRHAVGFWERVAAHPGLAPRLAEATPVGEVRGVGLQPGFVRLPGGPGWALVGDAGLHLDPWSAQGMDFASRHALQLAASIRDLLEGRSGEADAWERYRGARDAHALDDFRSATLLGRDLRQIVGSSGFERRRSPVRGVRAAREEDGLRAPLHVGRLRVSRGPWPEDAPVGWRWTTGEPPCRRERPPLRRRWAPTR